MRKEPITFDNLPQAVSYLTEQVEKIYQLLMTMQPQKAIVRQKFAKPKRLWQ